ncbi:hypothetical protein LCGC14_1593860 [marine sediment metagenome]|uniref:Uncharacterized protein n=1 Tax=marine sediment metagenome TaxID=412755 RepID=A0A0F9IZK5_9ZZZZ
MRDAHKRSITKAVEYKSVSIVLLAFLSGVFAIAIVGYYTYERIWERTSWGRKK